MLDHRKYGLFSRLLFRGKLFLDFVNNSLTCYAGYKMSRDVAKRHRKKFIAEKGRKVVNQRLLKVVKEYCKVAFGSTSYWPWLALYTELRGEFKEGWMPDDYYRFDLLPRMNPQRYKLFSETKIIDSRLFHEMIIEPLISRSNGRFYDSKGRFLIKSRS